MSAKVVGIGGAVIFEGNGSTVNKNALECAKEILARVEAGEVCGISAVLSSPDGSAAKTVGGFRKPWTTIGGLEEIKFDLLREE